MGDNSSRSASSSGELIRTKSRGGTPPNEIKTGVVVVDLNTNGGEDLMDGAMPIQPRRTATLPGRVDLTANTDAQLAFAANATTRFGMLLKNLGDASFIRVAYQSTVNDSTWVERIPPGRAWKMDDPIWTGVVYVAWEDDDGGRLVGLEYRR